MRLDQLLLCAMVAAACACGSDADDAQDRGDAAVAADGGGRDEPAETEVPCVDQSISQLMLFEDTAPPAISETHDEESGTFETTIDATAGGLVPTQSYVYARFKDDGLWQVDLGDEGAFESSDWDIAFRRYVIRLNSGVSGPGSVTGARTAPKTAFTELDTVPEDLEYRTEQYFTEACDYVSDGSGIGAPASALASFWTYQSCVAMTGNVYVLALPGGRHVKLEILAYYEPDKQAICNETGMVPMPSGAGRIMLRWAFLE
jgi:hypothetical protein